MESKSQIKRRGKGRKKIIPRIRESVHEKAVFTQQYDGLWNHEVYPVIEKYLWQFGTIVEEHCPEGMVLEIWITAVVISYLTNHVNYNSDGRICTLHINKARRRIVAMLGENLDQILASSDNFIASYDSYLPEVEPEPATPQEGVLRPYIKIMSSYDNAIRKAIQVFLMIILNN